MNHLMHRNLAYKYRKGAGEYRFESLTSPLLFAFPSVFTLPLLTIAP
jgi:hypothetical protein